MAILNRRRPENVGGNFYVDSTCIDCDACRWIAPEVFRSAGEQSAVYHQPISATERLHAMQALLSCPTASIGAIDKPEDVRDVQKTFPILIAENVYHCGYHAETSYGATGYFIQRPGGNVLVDSPRFTPPLVKRLEEMGGIRYLYLTHKDDVADHQKFRDHFKCDRIIHTDEVTSSTSSVEIKLTGLESERIESDLLIIPVPGHTKGHTVLLYKNKFLFSGDHLAWSEERKQLIAFRDACWYSWPEQLKSMRKLADYSFEWVLPGHGRRYHANSASMQTQLQKCIEWMTRA